MENKMALKNALKSLQSGNISTGIRDAFSGAAQNVISNATSNIKGITSDISGAASMYSNILPSNASGGIGNLISSVLPAISPSLSGSRSPSVLVYPETLNNISLNPAHINFQFYSRSSENTSEANLRSTSINLPMPDNVSNPSTISWDQSDFGMLGDTLVKGLKAAGSETEINTQNVQEKMSAMSERIKSLAFYTGMSNAVSGLGGANIDAGGLMGAVSGKMPNPYKTMLFRGVNFRDFSFEFRFVPFSASDCDLIDTIIAKFREHSYPDFAADKMFFTYPDECQITYMWESSHNKWLNNFKRAVCTGIDVNFAPLGHWSAARNGFPNMIILTTKWSEVEVITKSDIKYKDTKNQRS